MNLPRNAQAIVTMRAEGWKPEDPVIVSYVGDTGFDNPHVYANSGEEYDWRFLKGLQVSIFVRPNVNAKHAMKALFAEADLMQGYPWLVDVELKHAACIIENNPIQLWHLIDGSDIWQEFFA